MKKEELNGLIDRLNEKFGPQCSIKMQRRSSFYCFDLFIGETCERMLFSTATYKETIKALHAMLWVYEIEDLKGARNNA
jgi:hypothetical protein